MTTTFSSTSSDENDLTLSTSSYGSVLDNELMAMTMHVRVNRAVMVLPTIMNRNNDHTDVMVMHVQMTVIVVVEVIADVDEDWCWSQCDGDNERLNVTTCHIATTRRDGDGGDVLEMIADCDTDVGDKVNDNCTVLLVAARTQVIQKHSVIIFQN